MDLQSLGAFQNLATRLHFGRAARDSNLSTSALSRTGGVESGTGRTKTCSCLTVNAAALVTKVQSEWPVGWLPMPRSAWAPACQ